jgi:hypothetical protein
MKWAIELIFSNKQGFLNGSFLLSGLDILRERKVLNLICRPPQVDENHLVKCSHIFCIKVRNLSSSKSLLFAFDFHDKSDSFDLEIIKCCDFYFKRNFSHHSLSQYPEKFVHKVIRHSLITFSCRTKGSDSVLFGSILRNIFRTRRTDLQKLYAYYCTPMIQDFQQTPAKHLDSSIVFQTRVWEDYETLGESEIINEQRVNIIRELKKAFGNQFHGGLVPTPLARRRYPNEITPFSSRRKLYIKMCTQNLIAVYTRGLHHSTAWKLAEYLAASQCIVAETWQNEFAIPLVKQKNYLAFETPEECVAMCQTLLNSPLLATQMRQANYDYYRNEVEPSAKILNILNQYAF